MMKKNYRTIFIALLLLPVLGISFDAQAAFAQTNPPPTTDPCSAYIPGSVDWRNCDMQNNPSLYKSASGCGLTDFLCNFTDGIGPKIVEWILKFVALFTGIAGSLLNGVVYYTVVNVKENYDNLKPLLATWQVIRDLANMSFIFVLLYAGIRTMLGDGGETRRLITGVVIAAVLMNFSLFFTRLVIDAANILALTFYNAISPNSLSTAFDWSNGGLATAFMEKLHLQALYDTSSKLNAGSIIVVGIMGSIMLLVAAFVFLAIAIMFLIRYVVLLVVLILSPVFFLASAFPKGMGLEDAANRWKNALFGQAFFAPIFFLLIWISLRLLDGMMEAFGGTGTIDATAFNQLALGNQEPGNIGGAFMMFFNFSIVIALLLLSLSVAKNFANKAGGGMSKATDWATGKAGGLTFGAVGTVGRGTAGRAGQAIGENERLKAIAAKGGGVGFIARQTLQAGRGVGSATFDARGAGIGGKDAGKVTNKGGYAGYVKDKAKQEEDFVKTLGASDKTKAVQGGIRTQAVKDMTGFQKEYDEAVRNYGADSSAARNAERYLNEAKAKKAKADQLLGNKDEVEKEAKKQEEEKRKQIDAKESERKKEVEKIKSSEELKAAELAERSAQDTVSRLQAKANATIDTVERDQALAEIQAAKENLKKVQETARGVRESNKERIEAIGEKYDEEIKAIREKANANIETIKSSEVKSSADRNKETFIKAVENSRWAEIRGYNYAAAAKIRGGKSSKDKAADILKDLAKDGVIPGGEDEKKNEGGEEKKEGETKPAP